MKAAIEQDAEEHLYRVYMTDSAQLSGQRKYITRSWSDILKDKKRPVDNRSGDEVAADVIMRLGLIPKGVK